jgi:pyruvate dehydrogenase E1 component alpha subunit
MTAMLKEVMGNKDGLCGGMAGHMHLMSSEHLAAASGIVGASGPMAAGFALSATRLRKGSVAMAFFGEGAANQGMMMESMNLASAWNLPVIFVCKDNGWAVTTRSRSVTGGELIARARAFGLAAWDVDGLEVTEVHDAAGEATARARRGKGPCFIRATCSRLDGHFLGDMLVRAARGSDPEGSQELGKIMKSLTRRGGASILSRTRSMGHMVDLMRRVRKETRGSRLDPLVRARKRLGREEAASVEARVAEQISEALEAADVEGG